MLPDYAASSSLGTLEVVGIAVGVTLGTLILLLIIVVSVVTVVIRRAKGRVKQLTMEVFTLKPNSLYIPKTKNAEDGQERATPIHTPSSNRYSASPPESSRLSALKYSEGTESAASPPTPASRLSAQSDRELSSSPASARNDRKIGSLPTPSRERSAQKKLQMRTTHHRLDMDWEIDFSVVELGENLGSGAFGSVYRAMVADDLAIGIPTVVAVKLLKGMLLIWTLYTL